MVIFKFVNNVMLVMNFITENAIDHLVKLFKTALIKVMLTNVCNVIKVTISEVHTIVKK